MVHDHAATDTYRGSRTNLERFQSRIGRGRGLFCPAHFVDAHRVFKAAQRRFAHIGEEEPFACNELPHDVGGEDLARLRLVADAAGELHGGAE